MRRRAQEASEARSASNDRASAEAASHYCPTCGGQGLVTLYDRRYDGRRIAELPCLLRGEITTRPFPMLVMGHCTCPLGRWMRSKVDDAARRGIPDLERVLSGGTRWILTDPARGEDAELPAGMGWRELARHLAGDLAERSAIG